MNYNFKIGDLVFAKADIDRGFIIGGIVLDIDGGHCYVLWGTKGTKSPQGWWLKNKLKKL